MIQKIQNSLIMGKNKKDTISIVTTLFEKYILSNFLKINGSIDKIIR